VSGPSAAGAADPSVDELATVRVMPVMLWAERADPPGTPLLEAAARAALAVCPDPRSGPGEEWHDAVAAWVAVRKVARRARGAHWARWVSCPE
jgi:hypothetical protein